MADIPPLPRSGEDVTAIKEPHLLDFGNIPEIVKWIAMFLLGLLGEVAYDLTKDAVRDMLANIKRRFGKPRVREIEARVSELIAEVKARSNVSNDEISARLNEIFEDFR